jgi:hypothetical protein
VTWCNSRNMCYFHLEENKKSLECTTLTHENVKSDHIGIYVKLHSWITDSKREDEDPKWNIHKCDLGLWKQTTKDQFSNVQGTNI